MRVAILGAGGRVGSALLADLTQDPSVSAYGVCRNDVIAGPLRLAGYEVRCGSIRDAASAEALLAGADVVINCAVDAGWASTAADANRRVLEGVGRTPGIRKLVQFSSIGVYGTCITRGRATRDRPRPHARYAREKLDQEHAARRCERDGIGVLILRMGHVYGPYQWLSRSIFEFLGAGMALPFDGRLASNAIHVDNVRRAVRWLLFSPVAAGAYDLLDRPQRSWRELVDAHADSIGVPSLAAMDDAASRELARRYRAMESVPLPVQVVRELATALGAFPTAFAVSSPSAIALSQRVLGSVRLKRLEGALRAAYARTRAKRAVATVRPEPPPWLLSDESPGDPLPYPTGSAAFDDRAIAEWYRGYAEPPPLDGLDLT